MPARDSEKSVGPLVVIGLLVGSGFVVLGCCGGMAAVWYSALKAADNPGQAQTTAWTPATPPTQPTPSQKEPPPADTPKVKGKPAEVDPSRLVTAPRFTISRKTIIQAVVLSPSGSLLTWAEMPFDVNIHIWDVNANKSKADRPSGVGYWGCLAFSNDEKYLAVGGTNGYFLLWDVEKLEAKNLLGHTKAIAGVAFLADNQLVSSSVDRTIRVWDVETGKATTAVALPGATLHKAVWSANGRLAATFLQGELPPRLWDMQTGKEWAKKLPMQSSGESLALSPDAKLLALGGFNGEVMLWNTQTGTTWRMLTGHKASVSGVCFSADGKLLATASGDKTARVWDIPTGKVRTVFEAHQGALLGVSLSGDGKVLATCGRDQTIMVWDVPAAK